MTTDFELLNPLAEPEWDDLVAAHPRCSFFHSAAWARVLSNSYGYTPLYLAAVTDGKLSGLIPFMEIRSPFTGTRGVSLPFADGCDFFLPEGVSFEQAIQTVIDVAHSRRWKTFELRGRVPGMETVPAYKEYYCHVLDLSPGEHPLFSRFRENVQRNIRKVERERVTVQEDASPSGLRQFYRLNCITRRRHGLPPQPFRFFESLRDHVLSQAKGMLLLARHEGNCISGAVFLHFKGNVIFKYGASDRRFQHLRANNLVLWQGIRHSCSSGFGSLSFGRTDLGQDGLRRFKRSWGCAESRLKYSRFDVRSRSWCDEKKPSNVPWRSVLTRMPIPVLRALGTVAYRHIA